MKELLLSSYILVWPVISTAVLVVLIVALVNDMRAARRDGDSMI
ncbi:putative transporter small subunit [Candidimonas sp. SYP-B2681]|nr:putative transporter small subunit [Candidimonas sp. SYP-B2681]